MAALLPVGRARLRSQRRAGVPGVGDRIRPRGEMRCHLPGDRVNRGDVSLQKRILLFFLLNFAEGGRTGFCHGNSSFPSPCGEEHVGLGRCVCICVLCIRFS